MLKRPSILFSTNHQKIDNVLLRLLNLNINGLTVERESSIKFLGVWIDQNLTRRNHIHTVENKTAKNIGLLYRKIKNKSFSHIFLKLFGVSCHAYRTNFSLTHFSPVSQFSTPWKRQKTKDFSDVFRGYRNGTLD